MLVTAVLRPEQREDRELEVIRLPREQLTDSVVLGVGKTERLMQRLFGNPRQRPESRRDVGGFGANAWNSKKVRWTVT